MWTKKAQVWVPEQGTLADSLQKTRENTDAVLTKIESRLPRNAVTNRRHVRGQRHSTRHLEVRFVGLKMFPLSLQANVVIVN